MLVQPLPPSARRYAAAQKREAGAARSAVRRLWRAMGDDFDVTYARIEPQVLTVVSTAQGRMAAAAQQFIPEVMTQTGLGHGTTPAGRTSVGSLVGVDGSGRPLPSLLYGGVTDAKAAIATGASPAVALHRGGLWLDTAVGTALSDTARQSEALGIGVRPTATGYVRMLNGPSCSRCVLLAGKRVKSAEPFQRHPGCDCRHIPAAEDVAGDLTVDPGAYFDGLTRDQQDTTFGVAGAEAIRAGADMGQVVNARRGMAPSQAGGKTLLTTTEGMTRRGLAYQRIGTTHGAARDVKVTGQRYRRTSVARLMPETIAQVATDYDDYLRLLYTYGYLI